MVDATAGCVWGWLRPSRVDAPDAGQAGGLAKAGAAARRRAGATIQACTVVASAIYHGAEQRGEAGGEALRRVRALDTRPRCRPERARELRVAEHALDRRAERGRILRRHEQRLDAVR